MASGRQKEKKWNTIYLLKQFPMISISILFSIGLRNANRMPIDAALAKFAVFSLHHSSNIERFVLDVIEAMVRKGQMDIIMDRNQNLLKIFCPNYLFRLYCVEGRFA